MYKTVSDTIKLWLLASIFSTISFSQYFISRTNDSYAIINNSLFLLFLLFLIAAFLFSFQRNQFSLHTSWSSLFIIFIVLINLFLIVVFPTGYHTSKLASSVNLMYVFLLAYLIVGLINPKVILSVLNLLYIVGFIIGVSFLGATFFGTLGTSEILNENTRGFLIAPLGIYLFINQHNRMYKWLFFIGTVALLLYADAKTTLLAFILLPAMMYLYRKFNHPRIIYTVLLVVGIFFTVLAGFIQSPFVTSLLSHRDILWLSYMQGTLTNLPTILFGTGTWGVEHIGVPQLEGLNAHNTFFSFFHFNGLLALGCYLLFIIFSIRRKATTFTTSDGVLFLTFTFQFLESNVPLFTFVFPSFIFLFNILLNKEVEQNEKSI
jgi:hypothetical protein